MRRAISLLMVVVAVGLLSGCKGPEKKLGRGMNNLTEVVRLGEWRRSMEQAALWQGDSVSYTAGFVHGLNRTVARTFVGAYEILTFPIPTEPIMKPVAPLFPDSYRPGLLADTTFAHDSSLGFSGGDVAPFIPGSRFRIFDY